MKRAKRYFCTLLMAALVITSLAACSIGSNKVKVTEYSKTVVANYGDQPIYLDEVYYLVKVSQVTFDYYYSIFGGDTPMAEWYDSVSPLFGSTNLTTWNMIREDVFRSLYQTRVLCDQAERLGVKLEEKDLKKIEDAVANTMKEENRTVVDAAHATESLIRDIYTKNALANKVHEKMSEGYSTDIVRDEYKTALVSLFTVTKDTKDETDEKAKAEAIEKAILEEIKKLEAAELEKTEEQKKEEIKEEDKEEEHDHDHDHDHEEENPTKIDFDAIKKKLTDGSDVKNPVNFSLNVAQNVGISKEMTELENAVWSMKAGDVKLVDAKNAYYVIYLVTDDDEEAVQEKIDNALNERKEKKFQEEYAKVLETAPKLDVINKIYEANIKFEEIKYPEPTTAEATTTVAAATTVASTEATTAEAETTKEATTEVIETTEEEQTEALTEEEESSEEATEEATTAE